MNDERNSKSQTDDSGFHVLARSAIAMAVYGNQVERRLF